MNRVTNEWMNEHKHNLNNIDALYQIHDLPSIKFSIQIKPLTLTVLISDKINKIN